MTQYTVVLKGLISKSYMHTICESTNSYGQVNGSNSLPVFENKIDRKMLEYSASVKFTTTVYPLV